MTDKPPFLQRLAEMSENLAAAPEAGQPSQKRAARDIREALTTIDFYQRALESIAKSTCCGPCEEAAKVARIALYIWSAAMIPEIEDRYT